MEEVMASLADTRRIAIVDALLRGDDRRGRRPSQTQLREQLGIPSSRKGTLKKDLDVLIGAGVLVSRDGRYEVVHAGQARALLAAAAQIHATISTRRASEAEVAAREAAAVARRWRKELGTHGNLDPGSASAADDIRTERSAGDPKLRQN